MKYELLKRVEDLLRKPHEKWLPDDRLTIEEFSELVRRFENPNGWNRVECERCDGNGFYYET